MARSGACARLLLDAGARWIPRPSGVEAREHCPESFVHTAAAGMCHETIGMALSAFGPHERNKRCRTPLMACASPRPDWSLGFPSYDPRVVEALLAAGADPRARDSQGFSAIELAAVFGARAPS